MLAFLGVPLAVVDEYVGYPQPLGVFCDVQEQPQVFGAVKGGPACGLEYAVGAVDDGAGV